MKVERYRQKHVITGGISCKIANEKKKHGGQHEIKKNQPVVGICMYLSPINICHCTQYGIGVCSLTEL